MWSIVTGRSITIASTQGAYDVSVGVPGMLEAAISGSAVVVVDSAVAHLLPPAQVPTITVEATEDTKTMAGTERLVLDLRDAGVRRGDQVLAVGGGVVQDLATFATDIYMRGLPWTYVPTTLMAMADSCIGGKSSINAGGVKNLVGGFHPPTQVVVDERFLATLSPSAVSAGLAEAVKIAFCRGNDAFEGYLERYGRFDQAPVDLLLHVLAAKKWFIEVDEHDQKERLLLNFGHTFGHALEVAVAHSISHGAGVAVGVLCALRHPATVENSGTARLEAHCRELLGRVDGLPVALRGFDATAFERAFRSDKKHRAGQFHLILPAPGEGVRDVTVDSGTQGWADVRAAVDDTLGSLTGVHA